MRPSPKTLKIAIVGVAVALVGAGSLLVAHHPAGATHPAAAHASVPRPVAQAAAKATPPTTVPVAPTTPTTVQPSNPISQDDKATAPPSYGPANPMPTTPTSTVPPVFPPNVIGDTLDQARAAITAAGLTPGVSPYNCVDHPTAPTAQSPSYSSQTPVADTPIPGGQVTTQNPPSTMAIQPGGQVTVTVVCATSSH